MEAKNQRNEAVANKIKENGRMPKKATIVISLVKESVEKANAEIEKEILKELFKGSAQHSLDGKG